MLESILFFSFFNFRFSSALSAYSVPVMTVDISDFLNLKQRQGSFKSWSQNGKTETAVHFRMKIYHQLSHHDGDRCTLQLSCSVIQSCSAVPLPALKSKRDTALHSAVRKANVCQTARNHLHRGLRKNKSWVTSADSYKSLSRKSLHA